jgi:type VI secretion system protein ImpF
MSDGRNPSGTDPAGRSAARRAQLPLLDRLMDADPSESADRPVSSAAAMQVLRTSVRNDLEELLNARRRWRSWDPRFAELDRSLVGFGLPDFAAGAFNDPQRREELCQVVETCIRRFEPRIANLHVSLVEMPNQLSPTLRLRIEALLKAEPAPEPIAFDTMVDLDTKNVTISAREA